MSEIQNNIVNHVEKTLKDNFIKNIIIGFESANQMILDYCDSKEDITVEDIKNFCKKNLESKELIQKIALKERKE